MSDQEIGQLFGIVLIQLIITYPICRIYRRAGFRWYWGLLTLVPLAGFFMVPGALGFTTWPSTTRAEIKPQGQHSLIWVAAFSALFWFGVPGGESKEMQSLLTLAFVIYCTMGVAAIYENAGYSRWGGIMGLLGITNLIWPWIIAFRKWPTVVKVEEFKAAEEKYRKEQDLKLAKKFDIDPNKVTELGQAGDEKNTDSVRHSSSEKDQPPPIPKSAAKQEPQLVNNPQSSTESESIATDLFDENAVYERIAAELSGSKPRAEGTYLRAEVEANGDQEKLRLIYTRLRKEQLFQTE